MPCVLWVYTKPKFYMCCWASQVHVDCYAVRDRPDGRLWLCDVCALGAPPTPHDNHAVSTHLHTSGAKQHVLRTAGACREG